MYYDFFNSVILKTSCIFKVKRSIYHSRGERRQKSQPIQNGFDYRIITVHNFSTDLDMNIHKSRKKYNFHKGSSFLISTALALC